MKEEVLEFKFDGACDNNSKLKLMGIGVAVWIDGVRVPEFETHEMIGSGTNNIAEWSALNAALTTALAYYKSVNQNIRVRVYGDSQLVVNQFKGVFKVKQPHLQDYYKEGRQLMQALEGRLKLVAWIPREQNTDADALSKKALVDYVKSLE